MKIPLYLTVFIALLAVAPPSAFAQNAVPRDVVASGGGTSSGGGLQLDDTIGQSVIGVISTTGTTHKIGYRYVIDAMHIGPTSAVLIAAFTARNSDHAVELAWEVASADGLAGFNVYRSAQEDGSFARVNPELIPPDAQNGFRDEDVRPATTYWYRLGAIDADGEFFSSTISVETPPAQTTLYQNYPNPFNPTTTISFYLAERDRVVMTIYDARGKRVRQLVDDAFGFGKVDVSWDGTNDRGESVGSGVYFCRLQAGKEVFTKKLTLLK